MSEAGKGEGREAQTELERPPSDRRTSPGDHSAATSCWASARTRRTVPACAPTSFDTTSCSPRPSQCWSTLFQRSPMARSCPVSSRAIGLGKTTMSGSFTRPFSAASRAKTSALGRPAREDLGPGGLRLDRDQRAQERVRLEIEKPSLVDETARLDQTAGALLALLVADARFLLGEARLLLLEAIYAFSESATGHHGPPWIRPVELAAARPMLCCGGLRWSDVHRSRPSSAGSRLSRGRHPWRGALRPFFFVAEQPAERPGTPGSAPGARARYISRSTGGSAVRSAAYNAREAIYAERTGALYYFKHRDAPEHHEVLLPEGAGAKLADAAVLWNAAEAAERRKDAQLAREIVLALPANAELTIDDRIELARRFAIENFVSKGLAVQLDVHAPHAGDLESERANWGTHPLITTRRVEGEGFERRKPGISSPRSSASAGAPS